VRLRELRQGVAVGTLLTNLLRKFPSHFGCEVLLASLVRAVLPPVGSISNWGIPSQVVSPVVGSAAVSVANLRLLWQWRWQKRFGNQAMNQSVSYLGVAAEGCAQVPGAGRAQRQGLACT
jgi:hypothetical protein